MSAPPAMPAEMTFEPAPAGTTCEADGYDGALSLLGWFCGAGGRRLYAGVSRPTVIHAASVTRVLDPRP